MVHILLTCVIVHYVFLNFLPYIELSKFQIFYSLILKKKKKKKKKNIKDLLYNNLGYSVLKKCFPETFPEFLF